MSDATPSPVQPPSTEDIGKLIAQLRDDQTEAVRGEVADRLVVFAAQEQHPRAKGALLERAAGLVTDHDDERAGLLLRESFRQHPRYDVGVRLCELVQDDESLTRLGRIGLLFDATAALAPEDERPWALLRAARVHVEQGHGRRALAALDALGTPMEAMADDPRDLRDIAQSQVTARDEMLTSKRMEIAEATDDERGRVLLEYAQLLLAGDEPLTDACMVLADAVDAGANREEAAPLWAEVARAVGDPEMLGRALAASLECDQPMHERLRTADELANRAGIDVDQPDVARRALEVLHEALPTDLGVQARLLALRAIAGDAASKQHLDQLRLHTVKERDRDAEALVCLALARVAIHGSDAAQAERFMRRVRTLDPRNADALDFFERLYTESGDHKRLYMVLSHRLPGAVGDAALRMARSMAELAEGPMQSPERAVESWHRVLALAPGDAAATTALAAHYERAGRWAELRDLLARLAESAGAAGDKAAQSDALARRAALHGPQAALADPRVHLHLWRQVVALTPDRDGADAALDGALRAQGQLAELADRLQARLADSDAGRDAARTLLPLALDELDDEARARAALATLADSDADLTLVERAARALSDDQLLLSSLQRRRAACDSDDDAVELLEEAAALAAWALDDRPRAIALFEDLRSLRPTHPAALRGLARLYAAKGDVDAQIGAIRALLAEDIDEGERVGLLASLVRALAEGKGDLEAAQAAVDELKSLRPDTPLAAEIAERAALASGDLAGLRAAMGPGKDGATRCVERLEALAADAEGRAAVDALLAAAQVSADELESPERATEFAGLALAHADGVDGEAGDALVDRAATALLGYARSTDDAAWQEQALQALSRRGPTDGRAGVARELAERAEDRDDWADARASWLTAVAAATDPATLVLDADRLCEAAERCDDGAGVIAAIADAAQRHDAADTTRPALLAAATWAAGGGVTLDAALALVDSLLADGDAVDALQVRELVLTEAGRWSEVVTTVERLAGCADAEERVEALRRAAGVSAGVANDAAKAATLYAAVIEAAPDDEDAWAGRLAALERAGDEPGLREALDAYLATAVGSAAARAAAGVRRVELTDDAPDETVARVAAALLPATVERGALSDDEELLLTVAAARLDVPEQAKAMAELLLPVVRAHKRWDEVLRCREILDADVEPGSAAHVAALIDQAELAHNHSDDGDAALTKALAAVSHGGEDVDVWRRALAIGDARGDARLDAALDVAAGLAAGEAVDDTARGALLRLAAERGAADADASRGQSRAAAAWSALIALDPTDDEAHTALELAYRELGDFDAAALAIEARLGATEDADVLEQGWLRLASLHGDERGNPGDATAALAAAVARVPASEALWTAYLDALREADDERALIDGLSARIAAAEANAAATEDAEAVIALTRRELAAVASDAQPALALRQWLLLLRASPEDAELATGAAASVLALAAPTLGAAHHADAREVADALELLEEHDLLDAVLAALAAGLSGDDAVAAQLERARRAGDDARRFAALAQAVVAHPTAADLIDALTEAATTVAASEACDAWQAAAAACDGDDAVQHRLRAATAALRDADLREDALASLESLWRAHPTLADFAALTDALVADGRDAEARALRLERLELPDGVAAAAVRSERAALAAEFTAAGDVDSARAQWQQLVLADATDAEAVAALRALASNDDEQAEIDALLGAAAAGLTDASARRTLQQQLGTRALEREAWAEAADLFDALLAETPADAETWQLRDLALEGLQAEGGDVTDRVTAHLRAGIDAQTDSEAKHSLQLRLVAHLADGDADGDAAGAFAAAKDALETAPEGERGDVLQLAVGQSPSDELATALLRSEVERFKTSAPAHAASALRALATRQGEDGAEAALAAHALAPSDEDAALLQSLWDAGARAPDLVDALATLADDDAARAALYAEAVAHHGANAAETWLTAWADADTSSLQPLAERLARAPGDEARWTSLASRGTDRDALLEALLSVLDSAQTPADQALLLVKAADVAEAGDDAETAAETAAAYLSMALERNDDAALRRRRRELLAKSGDQETLAEALEAEAASAGDDDEKAALLGRAVDLWAGELADPSRALTLLDTLAELRPDDERLALRRVRVQRAAGDEGWASAAVGLLSGALSQDPQAQALAAAGHLASGSPAAALPVVRAMADKTLARDVIATLSDHTDALADADALEVLALHLEQVDPTDEPELWASLHLRRLAQLGDGDDAAAQLSTLDALVAHAQGPLADADLALDWSVRALTASSGDRDRAAQIVELADTPERQQTALPALREALTTAPDENIEGDVALFAALLDADHPGEATADVLVGRAVRDTDFARLATDAFAELLGSRGLGSHAVALRRASLADTKGPERVSGMIALSDQLAEGGDLAAALDALIVGANDVDAPEELLEQARALAESKGDDAAFVEAAERRAFELNDGAARMLVALAAGTAAGPLDDAARGADLWGRIWERDPDDIDARDAVLAMRRAADDLPRLADEIDRAVMQGGAGIDDLRAEQAALLAGPLEQPAKAVRVLRQVLRQAPGHAGAADVWESLSQHPEHAAEAFKALETIYRAQEQWAGVASALRRQIAAKGGDKAAESALRSLAEVLETHLDAPGLAADVWARIVAVHATPEAVQAMLRLSAGSEDAETLATGLRLALDADLSDEVRADVLTRAAAHARAQGDAAQAETWLRERLALTPDDVAVWDELDALLEDAGRWDELVALLQERVEREGDDQLSTLHRLAGIARAAGDKDAALAAYAQLSALDEESPDAHEAMVELLEGGDPELRKDTLVGWAGRLPAQSQERADALLEAARLADKELSDATEAAALYLQAFDIDPANDEAFRFVERNAEGDDQALHRLYRRRAEGVDSGPGLVVVLRRLASASVQLGRPTEARAALERALREDPSNETLQRELLEVCEDANDAEGYIAAAEARLEHDPPRVERVMLVRKLARMSVERGDEDPRWLDALKELAPKDPELSALRGLMQARSDDPETAAEGLEKVIRESKDEAEQSRLLERLAALYADQLNQPTKAIDALQRHLRLDPAHWKANERLCELYAARGSQEALAESLRRWDQALDNDDKARAQVLAQLGAVCLQLGRSDDASQALEQAYALVQDDLQINQPLVLVWMQAGRMEEAAKLQTQVVDQLRRARKRDELPAASARAGMLSERVGDHEAALKHYRNALKGGRADVDATLGLARVSRALGDLSRAQAEFEKVVALSAKHANAAQRAEASLAIGELHKSQGRRREARSALNRALDLQPGMKAAVDALADL